MSKVNLLKNLGHHSKLIRVTFLIGLLLLLNPQLVFSQIVINPTGSSNSSGDAPSDATYVTNTPNAALTNEQPLSALATGLMNVTATTGIVTSFAPTDDNLLVGNGSAWQLKALPTCSAGTSALTFNTTTNAFGCNSLAGSPAGSNTQVQFNNTGSFGADSGFTFNSSTDVLTVNSAFTSASQTVPTFGNDPPFRIPFAQLTITANPLTNGTIAAGTYYVRVYPISTVEGNDGDSAVGTSSNEVSVVIPGGGNGSIDVGWDHTDVFGSLGWEVWIGNTPGWTTGERFETVAFDVDDSEITEFNDSMNTPPLNGFVSYFSTDTFKVGPLASYGWDTNEDTQVSWGGSVTIGPATPGTNDFNDPFFYPAQLFITAPDDDATAIVIVNESAPGLKRLSMYLNNAGIAQIQAPTSVTLESESGSIQIGYTGSDDVVLFAYTGFVESYADLGFQSRNLADMAWAPISGGDFIVNDGFSLKTDTTTAHTMKISGYDVNATAFVPFVTVTNGNAPSFALAPSGDGTVSVRGTYSSNDGTAGLTQTCATAVVALTIKNGLITAVTCP